MSQKLKIQKSDISGIRKQLMLDLKTMIAELDASPEKYVKGIHFNKNYSLEMSNVTRQTIFIQPSAYLQMLQYTLKSSKEIAWHSLVEHTKENEYTITKCLLYPQTVTGATVSTDQEKYNTWVESLDDKTFNTMKCQAHSHVNMPTTPSSVDMNFYEDLVASLPNDSYYIFLVFNKQQSIHALIYDKKHNMLYTNEDIDVIVLDSENEYLISDVEIDIKNYISEPKPIGFSYNSTPMYTPPNYMTESKIERTLIDDETYWDRFYENLDKDLEKQTPRIKHKRRK